MLLLWVLWVAFFIGMQGLVMAVFAFLPPAIPFISFGAGALMVLLFLSIGLGTSKALMRFVEEQMALPVAVKS